MMAAMLRRSPRCLAQKALGKARLQYPREVALFDGLPGRSSTERAAGSFEEAEQSLALVRIQRLCNAGSGVPDCGLELPSGQPKLSRGRSNPIARPFMIQDRIVEIVVRAWRAACAIDSMSAASVRSVLAGALPVSKAFVCAADPYVERRAVGLKVVSDRSGLTADFIGPCHAFA